MNRNKYIKARVSKQEEYSLNVIAQRKSINLSETVRLLIREECEREGLVIGLAEVYDNIPVLLEKSNDRHSESNS